MSDAASYDYDLCVIGGGINGAGIARDAQLRGLKVLLVEAQDLAGATSSASTKLIHGGLRYLETYEFGLVRKSLLEREVLLKAAPHIIWPMTFVLPHEKGLRPAWIIRLGLFLYDLLGNRLFKKRILKKSGSIDFKIKGEGNPLKENYKKGFCYTDCWADDARLVVLNAVDVRERGGDVLTRTAVTHLEPRKNRDGWRVHLKNLYGGDEGHIAVRAVVNAGGPWVHSILVNAGLAEGAPGLRLVQGSHIIVPKIHDKNQAYILQQPDGRIVFAIPYEHKYTLIGTTDVVYEGKVTDVQITEEEKTYLIGAANRAFKKQILLKHIIWTYSGVRALVDDGEGNISRVTRDYKLYLDPNHKSPLLSVYGGKLTTYRELAEEAVDLICKKLGIKKKCATRLTPLPGGEMLGGDFDAFLKNRIAYYDFLPKDLVMRYARSYGLCMDVFLDGAKSPEDLGVHYGDHVYEAEIIYLIAHEFAQDIDDIIWRRTKLGLHISQETYDALSAALPGLLEGVKNVTS